MARSIAPGSRRRGRSRRWRLGDAGAAARRRSGARRQDRPSPARSRGAQRARAASSRDHGSASTVRQRVAVLRTWHRTGSRPALEATVTHSSGRCVGRCASRRARPARAREEGIVDRSSIELAGTPLASADRDRDRWHGRHGRESPDRPDPSQVTAHAGPTGLAVTAHARQRAERPSRGRSSCTSADADASVEPTPGLAIGAASAVAAVRRAAACRHDDARRSAPRSGGTLDAGRHPQEATRGETLRSTDPAPRARHEGRRASTRDLGRGARPRRSPGSGPPRRRTARRPSAPSAAARRPTRSTSRRRSSAGRSWAATTSTAATAPDTPRASPVWRPCSVPVAAQVHTVRPRTPI